MTLRDHVMAALEGVNDPHVPVSLRRMGMLRDVEISAGGHVRVQVCIPCMACPGAGMVQDSVRDAVLKVDGIVHVEVEEAWHLPWSPDMIEPEVQDLMRANGIQV